MLLNILQYNRTAPTPKNDPAPKVSSAKAEQH